MQRNSRKNKRLDKEVERFGVNIEIYGGNSVECWYRNTAEEILC